MDVAAGWAPPRHPLIFEIDTWPWLHALSVTEGRRVDLGSVPDGVWDAIAAGGYDLVWLMGCGSAAAPVWRWRLRTRTSCSPSGPRSRTSVTTMSSGRRT